MCEVILFQNPSSNFEKNKNGSHLQPLQLEISNLSSLIDLKNNEKIVDKSIKRLTAPGENYGSLMLSVHLLIKSDDNKSHEIYAVAKKIPPNEWLQKVFETPISFRNEIQFYQRIIPTLKNFQKQQGLINLPDIFPKVYGSRLNLDKGDNIDENAVLLLENLKLSGYTTVNRRIGFDFETTKLIIKNMALFHATPLALRNLKPEVMQRDILPYLNGFNIPESDWDVMNKKVLNVLIDCIDGSVLEKIKQLMPDKNKPKRISNRDVFKTISHEDLWVNNLMIKFSNGKADNCKFIDFQVCGYKSFACDLVFFLFTSVQFDVIRQNGNIEYFLELYRTYFYDYLKELNAFNEKLYTKNAFYEEIKIEAKNSQLYHILFMLDPICAPKSIVKDINEVTAEDLYKIGNVSEEHKNRARFIVQEYIKRQWLD